MLCFRVASASALGTVPWKAHNVRYFGANMAFGEILRADVMRSMERFEPEEMPKFCEERRVVKLLLRIAVEDTPCRDS